MAADAPHTLFCMPASPCTASGWVARLLNAHPDVFCSHDLGNRAAWSIEPVGRFATDAAAREDSTLAFCLSLMLQTGYRARGEINGVALSDWLRVQALLPDAWRDYKAAFALDGPDDITARGALLVRHPVLQVDSYARIEERSWQGGRQGDAVGIEVLRERVVSNDWDWPLDDVAFADRWAFLTAAVFVAERAFTALQADLPLFRMEDVTTKVAVVKALVAHLTADGVTADEALITAAMTAPTNRHRPIGAPRDAATTYAGWPQWRRDVFDRSFTPYVRKAYADLGYELGNVPSTVTIDRPMSVLQPLRRSKPVTLWHEVAKTRPRHLLLLGDDRIAPGWFVAARDAGLSPVFVADRGQTSSDVPTVPADQLHQAPWCDQPIVLAGEAWRPLVDRLAAVGWHRGAVFVVDPAAER